MKDDPRLKRVIELATRVEQLRLLATLATDDERKYRLEWDIHNLETEVDCLHAELLAELPAEDA